MNERPDGGGEAFVLLEESGPEAVSAAAKALVAAGARVLQTYPGALVVLLPGTTPVGPETDRLTGVAASFEGAIPSATVDLLPDELALAARAWNLRQSAAYRARKATRPGEGQPWRGPGDDLGR